MTSQESSASSGGKTSPPLSQETFSFIMQNVGDNMQYVCSSSSWYTSGSLLIC